MPFNSEAGASLLFYTGINYAGITQSVAHGVSGTLANGNNSWTYKSVAMSAMHAFCWSGVNVADASVNYQNHTESLITANISDLTALYSATAFPLFYLGIDPAIAIPVWLDMSTVSGSLNAVAATSVVGGATNSITTLSRPGLEGVVGFVGRTTGSSVVASCSYGTYNSANGQVAWSGLNAGTLVLEYTGGAVIILSATGFPAGWAFAAPVMQADGSWKITVKESGAGNHIVSVSSDKSTITNNGADAATLTALVEDAQNAPVAGVKVAWNTSLGNLSVSSSVTDSAGQATVVLTDSGDTGTAVVTGSLDNGSTGSTNISLNNNGDNFAMYCSTDALVASYNDYFRYPNIPTNKVAIYGAAGAIIQLSVDYNAQFVDTNNQTTKLTLDSTGFGLAEICAYGTCEPMVTATCGEKTQYAKMNFYGNKQFSCNALTPADSRVPCSFYSEQETSTYYSPYMITLSGSAHFSDGSQSSTLSYDSAYSASIDFVDNTSELVTLTINMKNGSGKETSQTESIPFVSVMRP